MTAIPHRFKDGPLAARFVFVPILIVLTMALTVAGCTKRGKVTNQALTQNSTALPFSAPTAKSEPSATPKNSFASTGVSKTRSYSLESVFGRLGKKDNLVLLSFSGGGTRAAALSYGVMKALRDTPLNTSQNTDDASLIDDVISISAVSGGSFTAAYYGLYKDRLFTDFENDFLRQNLQSSLIQRVIHPKRIFKSTNRTESAIELYDQKLFNGATFSDLSADGPMIILNASDLGGGVRFSFIQRYFDLLCSDLSDYSISRAVAASSAVPILFKPVVLKNHAGCSAQDADWMRSAFARNRTTNDPELALTVNGLVSYYNKGERPFVHLVDGGLTDNLGLRAIYDILEVAGGAELVAKTFENRQPRRLIFISVDASTSAALGIDQSANAPALSDTLTAITDLQLIRYNVSTVELTRRQIGRWAKQLSTPEQKVEPYYVHLDFAQMRNENEKFDVNQIPTSFEISDDNVDLLIKTGESLLTSHPEYKRLQNDL